MEYQAGAAAFVESSCTAIREWILADNHAVEVDPAAKSHWLGVVALLEKKPESQAKSGGLSFSALFGGSLNCPDQEYGDILEERDFRLFHADCMHMRCRHDPERSLRARAFKRKMRRLQNRTINLHLAQEKAIHDRCSRL